MKLRLILIILSIIGVISASSAGYIYYSSLNNSAYKEVEEELGLQTMRIQDTISSYLSENLKTVQTLAGLRELREALEDPGEEPLRDANSILDHFAKTLSVDVCYLMDSTGTTIASSNRMDSDSFVGRNFSFRPYWKEAIKGGAGTYMALGVRSKKRGIYYSFPVYSSISRSPLGVAVIKSPVHQIEKEFTLLYEGAVLFIDPRGIVFMSNKREWILHSLWGLSPEERELVKTSKQFGKGPWDSIGMRFKDKKSVVLNSGREYIIFRLGVVNYPGWEVIYLLHPAVISRRIAGPLVKESGPLILALCFLVGVSVFLLYRKASDDIKKRRQAEEALTRAEEELRNYSKDLEGQVRKRTREILSILKYTPAVVYIKDRDARYTYVNTRYEDLFHVKIKEIRGKTDYDIFSEEIAGQFQKNDLKVLKEGKPLNVEEVVGQDNEVRTYFSVKFPIFDKEGKPLGVCGISSDITDIKRAQDQLRRFSDSIIEGQEKERAAVSRELHDGLGQVLTALRMDAVWLGNQEKDRDSEAGERARSMCELIDRAIDEVRRMSAGLRPGVLDDLGIIDALDWYTGEYGKRTGIRCDFSHESVPDLPETLSTAIYRITQECLTNISKHASASKVDVTLHFQGDVLILSVTDNGNGFTVSDLEKTRGLGVTGMRERATLAGGDLQIHSQPGEGTRVVFKVFYDTEGGREVDQSSAGR